MIDPTPIFTNQQTAIEFSAGFTRDMLRAETNHIIDTMLTLLADCVDADVTFVPDDPNANEDGWTVAHIVTHTTATSEDGAFVAAELARGIEFHGHSWYETPWDSISSIAQVRHRLEESRRMRLASLDMWPDTPTLDNTFVLDFLGQPLNAPAIFVLVLGHEVSHLAQLEDAVRQAKAARA